VGVGFCAQGSQLDFFLQVFVRRIFAGKNEVPILGQDGFTDALLGIQIVSQNGHVAAPEFGVLATNPAHSGFVLTVLLGVSILRGDELGEQWQHHRLIRTDDGGDQAGVLVLGDLFLAAGLHYYLAAFATDLVGVEVARSVQGHQKGVSQAWVLEALERRCLLKVSQSADEAGLQQLGFDTVQNLANLGDSEAFALTQGIL
jgi:hypothetical protein